MESSDQPMRPSSPGAINSIRLLAHGRKVQSIAAGTPIFQAGDCGASMFAVLEGAVRLEWGDGRHYETFGPGEHFGVGALVEPEHRRFGTAIATEETRLVEMNREEFLFALQELPMFGLEMLHSLEERLRHLKQVLDGHAD